MANAVEKLNTIAIADIEKINTITDDNLEDLNTLEFSGSLPGLIDLTFSGLTWSTSTAIPAHVYQGGQIGTSSAGGIIIQDRKTLNEWNGSSWSTEDDMSKKHSDGGAGGTVAAGVVYGGYDSVAGADTETTEEYNGSSWSTSSGMNLNIGTYGGCSGGNVDTHQLTTGGTIYPPVTRDLERTELWNGSTWTNKSVDSNGLNGSQSVGTTDFFKPSGTYDATGMQIDCEYYSTSGNTWSSKANILNKTRYNKCWGDETRTFTCGGYNRGDYGAPVYYDYTNRCEMWVDNTWSSQTTLPDDIGGHGNGGSDGGSNVGGGWTAGGGSGTGNAHISLTSHYIAVAS